MVLSLGLATSASLPLGVVCRLSNTMDLVTDFRAPEINKQKCKLCTKQKRSYTRDIPSPKLFNINSNKL